MPLRSVLFLLLIASGVACAEDVKVPAGTQPPPADDHAGKRKLPRVRLGGIMLGAGYSHFGGRYPYGSYGYGPYFYDPFFYSPFIHPGFYTGFGYQPLMGEVKVQADKDSWVYLDGALAGRAGKLKNMWLEPGAYELELRSGGKRTAQRIYVLSGKTLKVTPAMMGAAR